MVIIVSLAHVHICSIHGILDILIACGIEA
jgi:hypothetical protein